MTVISDHNKHIYTANGGISDTDFDFTFDLQTADHLQVYLDDELTPGNSYTVHINANFVGGYVRFAVAPTSGQIVVLLRSVPQTQGTEIPTEANFPEKSITDMADRNVMMIQDLQEQLDRCIKLPATTQSDADLTLPTPEAGKVLVFNATGDALELVDRLTSSGTGTGDVTGPNGGVQAGDLAVFQDTTGKLIKRIAMGAVGTFLKSNGAGVDPSFANPAGGVAVGLWRASNITSSLRALPTSGNVGPGDYVHFGNWQSVGQVNIAHGTRIFIKGNFQYDHKLVGTPQANGGAQTGANVAGQVGGGPGGGMGGTLPKGGGAGGAGAGAGGAGGGNTAILGNIGGRAYTTVGPGGSGGGSGAGNAVSLKGQVGGGGGAYFYIEVDGNMIANEDMTANGQDGTATGAGSGAGGGGGGGQIEVKVSGNFTGATGKKMQANGGAGGVGSALATPTGRRGGGGGGGRVDLTVGGTQTFTGTYAIENLGGAAGATGTQVVGATAAAGSAGATNNLSPITPISR